MQRYFIEGFKLANKNIHLFYLYALITLIGYLPDFFPSVLPSPLGGIFVLLMLLINFTYALTIPKLIEDKEKSYKKILLITLKNVKRTIVPVILVLGFIILMYMLFVFSEIAFSENYSINNTEAYFEQFNTPFSLNRILVNLIFMNIFAFMFFQPLFFSLEGLGFFKSLFKAVKYSLRNLKFIPYVMITGSIWAILTSAVEADFYLGQSFIAIAYDYLYLILLCAALIYYKANKR